MTKIPKNYELVQTQDGSTTLFSKAYNEACHSLSGAREETKTHYLKACKIEERIQTTQSKIRILEIGFGTGIGFLETFDLFKKHNACSRLDFVSLEIDPELEAFFQREYKSHKDIGSFKDCLNIIIGDARETIKQLEVEFDAIYQDAFSPRRNPDLWTVEWFEDLRRLSHEQTVLSTYSASTRIRKSLLEAGWKLFSGARFGTKRSSTIAKLTGESEVEILEKLKRSPVGALKDCDIEEYRKLT